MDLIASWGFQQVEAARSSSGFKPSAGPAYAHTDGCPSFEGVETILELWQRSAKKYRIHRCMGVVMQKGKYSHMSYNEVNHLVCCLSSSLSQFVKGKSVAIWGKNSPGWLVAFLACTRAGHQSFLLHDDLGEEALEVMIKKSGASMVIVSPENMDRFAALVPKFSTQIETVVYWGKALPFFSEAAVQLRAKNVSMYDMSEFMEIGEEKKMMLDLDNIPEEEDIATVVFAKGPLGSIEGITYTHGAVISSIASIHQHFINSGYEFSQEDSMLSYLPTTHILNLTLELWFLGIGARIGYCQGKHTVLDDARIFKPTFFTGNANILERICKRISKMSQGVGIRGALNGFLSAWGYHRKLHFIKNGIAPRRASPVFDALVFRRYEQVLGGKQRVILVFGEPPSSEIGEVLRVCTSAAVHSSLHSIYTTCFTFSGPMNYDGVHTLGSPLPSITWRLQSIPELGHDALGEVPEGELLIKAPHNFSGFYTNPNPTLATFFSLKNVSTIDDIIDEDGWLHTGEIARLEDDRFVFIGKISIWYSEKKEKVLLEEVESVYDSSSLVKKIFVHPNTEGQGLMGILIPNENELVAWAKSEDPIIEGDTIEDLRCDPRVIEHISSTLMALGRKSQLRDCELLEKVEVKTEEELKKIFPSSLLSMDRETRPNVGVKIEPKGLTFKALTGIDVDKMMESMRLPGVMSSRSASGTSLQRK